jgi:hypothetical protein
MLRLVPEPEGPQLEHAFCSVLPLAGHGKPDRSRIYIGRSTARFRRLVDAARLDELDAEHLISA